MIDGQVTFAKCKELHELAFDVPLDRLLLASSSPHHLPTQANGGRRSLCHPGHITFEAERVAELKRGVLGAEDLLRASRENAARVFGAACCCA